jgi:hypothetical protein
VPISKEKPMIASSVKAEVVKSNARSANDTGSPEVQVALLTARINELRRFLLRRKQDGAKLCHSSAADLIAANPALEWHRVLNCSPSWAG